MNWMENCSFVGHYIFIKMWWKCVNVFIFAENVRPVKEEETGAPESVDWDGEAGLG